MHCFQVKKIKNKQNCYNADKVLSFEAPSGEQELTKIGKVNILDKRHFHVGPNALVIYRPLCQKSYLKFCRFIHLLQAKM